MLCLGDRMAEGKSIEIITKESLIVYLQRGLPHVHILIILHQEDKIRNTDQIDEHISAEIPNQ